MPEKLRPSSLHAMARQFKTCQLNDVDQNSQSGSKVRNPGFPSANPGTMGWVGHSSVRMQFVSVMTKQSIINNLMKIQSHNKYEQLLEL